MNECPTCHGPLTNVVTPDRTRIAYECRTCNTRHNLCLADKSDGSTCQRLKTDCPYHDQEA